MINMANTATRLVGDIECVWTVAHIQTAVKIVIIEIKMYRHGMKGPQANLNEM